jgi:hypothetical protein
VLNLEKLLQTGEISKLRVGMTMGDTVAAWGKPRARNYKRIHGLPTLFTQARPWGLMVIARNRVKTVSVNEIVNSKP